MKLFDLRWPLAICLSFIFLSGDAQKPYLKGLDQFLESQRMEWNVPGMSVALVKDGETIYEKGFGQKNTQSKEKVDEHSLFAIASNSKAYTATMIAMLIDEGTLAWDDRVQDYLSWFELYDPYVSANMTIRDLLCHRSGLATFSGDLYWYGSKHSAKDVVRMAASLEPAFDFRAGYGYQNIMFIAAGLIIEEVSGKSWSEFCRERILDPLGMSETLTSITEFTDRTNETTPHNEVEGENVPIEWVNWDNVVAAGGLISSVHDEAKWLDFNLNKGVNGSDTLVSPSLLYEMWEIHNTNVQSEWSRAFYKEKALQGYGLGWQIMVYKGHRVIHHGGGYDGMISHSFFLPETGVGGVVLTNNITSISYFLMYDLIDRLLGEKTKKSYCERLLPMINNTQSDDKKAEQEFLDSAIPGTSPSLALEDYVGTYRDQTYGDLIIDLKDDQLQFAFEPTPLFRGKLSHRHYDVFLIEWGEQMMLPHGTLQFRLDREGSIESINIDVPNPDFDFSELQFKSIPE